MDGSTRYPREVSVRLLFEHEYEYPSQWATITSAAGKLGHDAGDPALSVWGGLKLAGALGPA